MPQQNNKADKITAEKVTNEYLYGKDKLLTMDMTAYMQSAGRFANPTKIKILETFMNPWLYPKSYNLPAGEYSKEQLRNIWNMQNVKYNTHMFHQGMYGDNIKDRIERAYVWGSSSIKIHDSAKFVVEPNGNRYIKNFALVPEKNENFDFDGASLSSIANIALKPILDPNNIGSKVTIKFTGEKNVQKYNFTYQDYVKASSMYKSQDPSFKDIDMQEVKLFLQNLKQQTSRPSHISQNEINQTNQIQDIENPYKNGWQLTQANLKETDPRYTAIEQMLTQNINSFSTLNIKQKNEVIHNFISMKNEECISQNANNLMQQQAQAKLESTNINQAQINTLYS